jgi:peptidoglycan hydrolase CwlO-like protein
MDQELQQYNQNNSSLELSIAELKLKVKAAEKEVDKEKEKVKFCLAIVKRFKMDIQECVQHIQNPKLLKVRSIYDNKTNYMLIKG